MTYYLLDGNGTRDRLLPPFLFLVRGFNLWVEETCIVELQQHYAEEHHLAGLPIKIGETEAEQEADACHQAESGIALGNKMGAYNNTKNDDACYYK